MRRFAIIILLIFLPHACFGLVKSISVEMIPVETEIREKLIFKLENTTTGEISYYIPADADNILVSDNNMPIQFSEIDDKSGKKITFHLKNATMFTIEFITNDLIFKNGNVYQLFTTFNINDELDYMRVRFQLPKGYAIYMNQTYPPAEYLTNGENIIVSWFFEDVSSPVSVSVKFYNEKMSLLPLFGLVILIVIASIISIIYMRKKYKERIFNAFDEDERKVIELISSRRLTYQNKIEKKLGFSRAKMTRIVKRLESKGLIKKEKRGRTNKLTWIG